MRHSLYWSWTWFVFIRKLIIWSVKLFVYIDIETRFIVFQARSKSHALTFEKDTEKLMPKNAVLSVIQFLALNWTATIGICKPQMWYNRYNTSLRPGDLNIIFFYFFSLIFGDKFIFLFLHFFVSSFERIRNMTTYFREGRKRGVFYDFPKIFNAK